MFISPEFHKFAIVLIDTIAFWILLVVFLSNRKSKENRLFLLMVGSLFGWVNFAYLARVVESEEASIIFLKTAWFATPIFFLTIYLFSIHLLKEEKRFKNLTVVNFVITFITSTLSGFTNLVIESRIIREGLLAIVYGKAMWPYLIGATILMFSVIFALVFKRSKIERDRRKIMKPFIYGLTIFYIANLVFNISLPIFFGITRFYFIGDYSTILLTSLTAYSIVRHKFLGVKVALSAFLISVIGMLIIVDITILSSSLWDQIFKSIIFLVYLLVATLLIRSILTETRQKEEIERINSALEKSNERYLNLAREQKDIIDVMGHEVRTPLSVIKQELLLHDKITIPFKKKWTEGKASKEEVELLFETLGTITRATEQSIALVTDMLETARLEKKRFELNYSTFDLVEVVNSSVELMKKTLNQPNASIKFINPSKNKIDVEADKVRITESLQALINNAIKYGKNLTDKSIDIEVSIKETKSHVSIAVKDHGVGIEKEDIAKLGQKFLRLQPKTQNFERPGGTGLGLFVVKNVMKHHKGDLIIESDGIGKGSTFTLHFPLTRNQ
jgi:signal transduction histidine kinase